MAMINELERSGNWLFQRRSLLPLILYFIITFVFYVSSESIIDFPELWISLVGLIISFSGIAVRIHAVGYSAKDTSGRNRAGQVAGSVNKLGLYSMVRHPLYVGNFLMWFGLVVYTSIFWFAIIVALMYWLYYERIIFAEEAYLTQKFKDEYTDWANRTPCFIPNLKLWSKPRSSFSFKKIIKNEVYGLAAIAVSFIYINVCKNYFLTGKFHYEDYWLVFLVISLTLLFVIRFMKKKTHLLDE